MDDDDGLIQLTHEQFFENVGVSFICGETHRGLVRNAFDQAGFLLTRYDTPPNRLRFYRLFLSHVLPSVPYQLWDQVDQRMRDLLEITRERPIRDVTPQPLRLAHAKLV